MVAKFFGWLLLFLAVGYSRNKYVVVVRLGTDPHTQKPLPWATFPPYRAKSYIRPIVFFLLPPRVWVLLFFSASNIFEPVDPCGPLFCVCFRRLKVVCIWPLSQGKRLNDQAQIHLARVLSYVQYMKARH